MANDFLETPIQAVVFDCDGTLSHIEGIDELAKVRGVVDEVALLTTEAMEKTGITPELYARRLDLVRPSHRQVLDLGSTYFQYRTPDSVAVIQDLFTLNKHVYIVSAGLYPAVAVFASLLKIPKQNIFAVSIGFDGEGNYHDFDHESPLVQPEGKRLIVKTLQERHEQLLYVGDGMNDYAVYDLVTRFVGYGGAFYREKFAKQSQFYIETPTFKPLLPLCLTEKEFAIIYQNEVNRA